MVLTPVSGLRWPHGLNLVRSYGAGNVTLRNINFNFPLGILSIEGDER